MEKEKGPEREYTNRKGWICALTEWMHLEMLKLFKLKSDRGYYEVASEFFSSFILNLWTFTQMQAHKRTYYRVATYSSQSTLYHSSNVRTDSRNKKRVHFLWNHFYANLGCSLNQLSLSFLVHTYQNHVTITRDENEIFDEDHSVGLRWLNV